MPALNEIYVCSRCGNMVEVVGNGTGEMVCCDMHKVQGLYNGLGDWLGQIHAASRSICVYKYADATCIPSTQGKSTQIYLSFKFKSFNE